VPCRESKTDGAVPSQFVTGIALNVREPGKQDKTLRLSGREQHPKAFAVNCQIRVRAQGLEPWTYGLKVRCSTN
jgi:hypothetical protein